MLRINFYFIQFLEMNIVRILLTGLIYLPSIVGFIDNFHSLRKLERFRFREPLFSDFLDSYELPGPLKKFFETQRIETEIQNVVVNTTSLPIIAVIGRPNTGKSTLVNRICKHFQVILRRLIMCFSNNHTFPGWCYCS